MIAALALLVCQESKPSPETKPEIAPAEIAGAVRKGAALLIARQENLSETPSKTSKGASEPGREWPYEGVYRVDGEIPIGYRVGGTAIGAMALLEARAEGAPDSARDAVDRALAFVLEGLRDPKMSPSF